MAFDPEIESLIRSKEFTYQLPPGLLYGLVYSESRGRPTAFNRETGASGLTQIIAKYHPQAPENLFDAEGNLEYAASTLKRYADQFGSYGAALAAWHSGEGRVRSNLERGGDGIPSTKDSVTGLATRDYVKRILSFVDKTQDAIPIDTSPLTSGESLQSRPFDRQTLGIVGLGLIFLGALVLTVKQ